MSRILLYFDLETTGLSKWADRITQIGVTAVLRKSSSKKARTQDDSAESGVQFSPLDTFETFVNSGVRIHDQASRKTGITNQMLENAPVTTKAVGLLADWIVKLRKTHSLQLEPITLTAYNGMNFDFPVLLMELHRCNIPSMVFFNTHNIQYFLDPLMWARVSLSSDQLLRNSTGRCSFTLSDVYKSITGTDLSNAHTALADTEGLGVVCESEPFESMESGDRPTPYCVAATGFCSAFLQQKRSYTQSGKNNRRQQVSTLVAMQQKKRKRQEPAGETLATG